MGVHLFDLFGADFEYQIWTGIVFKHSNIQNGAVVVIESGNLYSGCNCLDENISMEVSV